MHFLKLVTDGQMSNLFSTYCNLNEDTKNHGILGYGNPQQEGGENKNTYGIFPKDKH